MKYIKKYLEYNNIIFEKNINNIKFGDISYKRPNINKIIDDLKYLIDKLNNSKSGKSQIDIINKITKIRIDIETDMSLVDIRNSINTKDKFYEEEKKFIDKISPNYLSVLNEYYISINKSKFKKELIEEFGDHFLVLSKTISETFDDSIIELLKKENKLIYEYNVIISELEIKVSGKKYNINNINPLLSDVNRNVRKISYDALYNELSDKQVKIDNIYDKLVKIRHEIAKKMGYSNYVDLAYKKLKRTDYNSKDISKYRNMIYKHVVPIINDLKEKKRNRLGYDTLKYYDSSLHFKSGNPKLSVDSKLFLKNVKSMYKELSKDTDEFLEFMFKNDLMDLNPKNGKMSGGYTTILYKYKYPFIFSNFNGTSNDFKVLSHEIGHAFQFFKSFKQPLIDYYIPTPESAEICSMSMEFFVYHWVSEFFNKDGQKYIFSHLSDSINILVYGAAIDEFQHYVYENPLITIKERNDYWLEIEEKYGLSCDNEDNKYLNSGRFWQKQSHIFNTPFYYIDYTISQICAFQFWEKSEVDFKSTWKDYLKLCSLGGSLSFEKLIESVGIESPFDEDSFKKTIQNVYDYINNIKII